MALDPIVFQNVSPGQWERIRAGLAADGILVNSAQGEMERDGVRIRWRYDALRQTLTVQCLKKPWIYPSSAVQSRLQETFQRLARA